MLIFNCGLKHVYCKLLYLHVENMAGDLVQGILMELYLFNVLIIHTYKNYVLNEDVSIKYWFYQHLSISILNIHLDKFPGIMEYNLLLRKNTQCEVNIFNDFFTNRQHGVIV